MLEGEVGGHQPTGPPSLLHLLLHLSVEFVCPHVVSEQCRCQIPVRASDGHVVGDIKRERDTGRVEEEEEEGSYVNRFKTPRTKTSAHATS